MTRKIFTATLGTETNTFSSLPTGLRLFEETCLFRKASYGNRVPMFGLPLSVWRSRAEARGWTVIESLCAFAQPAGKTVKRVYESFRDEIIADLKAAMPVDGVFLSMHGAMVAEGYDDCESDILAAVRKVVGPTVPVGVELDLHCNIGEGTLRDATALGDHRAAVAVHRHRNDRIVEARAIQIEVEQRQVHVIPPHPG